MNKQLVFQGDETMKPSIDPLVVRFVVSVVIERQTNMFTRRAKNIKVPNGDVRIFRAKRTVEKKRDGKEKVSYELFGVSMCGKARGDIGKLTAEYEARPSSKVCPECEQAWKEHPLSLWRSYVEATGIKTVLEDA